MGEEKYLECKECHKLLRTSTSTTNLMKHIRFYHRDKGESRIIVPSRARELIPFNFMMECNIPFNTLRKAMECMDTQMNEERLINIITSEASQLRERSCSQGRVWKFHVHCNLMGGQTS